MLIDRQSEPVPISAEVEHWIQAASAAAVWAQQTGIYTGSAEGLHGRHIPLWGSPAKNLYRHYYRVYNETSWGPRRRHYGPQTRYSILNGFLRRLATALHPPTTAAAIRRVIAAHHAHPWFPMMDFASGNRQAQFRTSRYELQRLHHFLQSLPLRGRAQAILDLRAHPDPAVAGFAQARELDGFSPIRTTRADPWLPARVEEMLTEGDGDALYAFYTRFSSDTWRGKDAAYNLRRDSLHRLRLAIRRDDPVQIRAALAEFHARHHAVDFLLGHDSAPLRLSDLPELIHFSRRDPAFLNRLEEHHPELGSAVNMRLLAE